MKQILLYLLVLLLIFSSALEASTMPEEGLFTGRISKINETAKLLRIKVNFENIKYLTKKDRVEFWSDATNSQKCKGIVVGKSNDFILLKIPNLKECSRFVFITLGGDLKFFSMDLVNNLKMGQELVEILLKKRMVINTKLADTKKDLENYMSKVEAVNSRYEVLREKLNQEWQEELKNLEEDNLVVIKNSNELNMRLNEVDYKLEQYRIGNRNLEVDRWALDARLFFEK